MVWIVSINVSSCCFDRLNSCSLYKNTWQWNIQVLMHVHNAFPFLVSLFVFAQIYCIYIFLFHSQSTLIVWTEDGELCLLELKTAALAYISGARTSCPLTKPYWNTNVRSFYIGIFEVHRCHCCHLFYYWQYCRLIRYTVHSGNTNGKFKEQGSIFEETSRWHDCSLREQGTQVCYESIPPKTWQPIKVRASVLVIWHLLTYMY